MLFLTKGFSMAISVYVSYYRILYVNKHSANKYRNKRDN